MHVLPHGTTHPWLQYIQESPLLVRLENCGSSKHCIGLSMVDRAFQPMEVTGKSRVVTGGHG